MNDYIKHRMELWLEPRLKKASDEEAIQIKNEAAVKFSLQNWLVDAAKRAGQLSITTHPSKFTHPSAKSTSVIANNPQSNDGYLRSGNVRSPLDVFGNAAAMDVYRFLSLSIKENYTVLDAFEKSDAELKAVIIGLGLDFDALQTDFLKIKNESNIVKTDSLLKQVYFPISPSNKTYHLLSLLTASGIMSEIKQRIDDLRFSEHAKNSRLAKRAGEVDHKGHRDLLDLTVVGYGGTKPQNISVLNNQNYGRSYLLPCIPPLFEKRIVRLPRDDFFTQTLYLQAEKDLFIILHKLVKQDRNNIEIRQKIQKMLRQIIDQILYKAYQLRHYHDQGWSTHEYYQKLPFCQRVWLDDIHIEHRKENCEWRDEIAKQMARIMMDNYDAINNVKILGDPELNHIAKLIVESIEEDKEFF